MPTYNESGWVYNQPGVGYASDLTVTYDPTLARVRLVASGLSAAAYAVVERSVNGVQWTTVRGGAHAVPAGGVVRLDDYEFPDAVPVTYRVRSFDGSDVLLGTLSGSVTPALGGVWLKSAAYPFLNTPVTVTGFGDVTAPARGAVYDVLARRDPVAVTEVRGSRRYELTLRAADDVEEAALELALSFGDTAYVHVPAGCVVPRSMWAFVGDVTISRPPRHDSTARYFVLPLTEVAAPDPAIVGATITWAGVTAAYATWADLMVAKPTWADVLESISAPADEVVG